MRDLHQPERLGKNALVRSRAVGDRGRDGDDRPPVDQLRDLLAEAVGTLRSHPRDEKLYRVLDRT